MKVSVIIPAYNEEKYIGTCLSALSSQTVKPDEIIVVDNNCTDNTASIAKQFKEVRIIKETKQGMIAARNTGFNTASGTIIARCDADSIPPPFWIERITENFTQDIDALSGPLKYDMSGVVSNYMTNLYFPIMRLFLNGENTLVGPNMIITKEIWMKIRDSVCLNDSIVHEDVDITIHILQKGGKIQFDPKLIMRTSSRRIKHNPVSFFIEYPVRMYKTLSAH